MGECLTYLRESLFSSTLAPAFCMEENDADVLNTGHCKLANQEGGLRTSKEELFVLTAGGPGSHSEQAAPLGRKTPGRGQDAAPRLPPAPPTVTQGQ